MKNIVIHIYIYILLFFNFLINLFLGDPPRGDGPGGATLPLWGDLPVATRWPGCSKEATVSELRQEETSDIVALEPTEGTSRIVVHPGRPIDYLIVFHRTSFFKIFPGIVFFVFI